MVYYISLLKNERSKMTLITEAQLKIIAQSGGLQFVELKPSGEKWLFVVNGKFVLKSNRGKEPKTYVDAGAALKLARLVGASRVSVVELEKWEI